MPSFKNDEDFLKYANKIFEEGNYEDAEPLFLQILSNDLQDPDYNFKYGTCLLHNAEDKQESIKHLYFAATNNADSRTHFFLGKAYQYNYEFVNALKSFQIFDSKGDDRFKKKYNLNLHIKQCQSGNNLLDNLTELIVEEKTETKIDNFPYSYDFEQMNGRIIISEEFQTKYDKKKGHRSMSFFPATNSGQNVVFYSSYGKNGESGLDLYLRKRLANGDWGEEEKLPSHINTPYDDAYGFLHSSGSVFYFCSQGHNSMGGFDVFKCTYDISNNRFGTPVNLDYKINTPDDDLMYVVDKEEENAYFASTRSAPGGFIDVYKVRVKSVPIINVLLSGTFDNQIYEDDEAIIKVQDVRNNEIVSVTKPDKEGKYMIILPKGGMYNFIVETEKSQQVHTEKVVIEGQTEFKPLKQVIELVSLQSSEKVIIKNLFEESIDDPELIAKALKLMADQDANIDNYKDELANEDNTSEGDEYLNMKTEDLIKSFKEGANDIQEIADASKYKMEGSYFVAEVKLKLADQKAKEAQEILATLASIEDADKRNEQAEVANQLNKESKDLYSQGQTAIELGNSSKEKYVKSQQLADKARADVAKIESNINSIDKADASEKIKAMQSDIENITKGFKGISNGDDDLVIQAKEAKDRANKKFEEGKSFRKDEESLILRKKRLEAQMEKARSKDKDSYQTQIDEVKEQIEQSIQWANESYEEAEKLDLLASSIGKQVQLVKDLEGEIESGSDTPLTNEEKESLFDFARNNTIESNITKNRENLLKYIPEEELGDPIIENGSEEDIASTESSNIEPDENVENSSDNQIGSEDETTLKEGEDIEPSVYDTGVAQKAQSTIKSIDKSARLDEMREANNKGDTKGLAIAENEVLNDWVNDLNEEYQNINSAMIESSGEEETELKEIQKSILEKKNKLESQIARNEKILEETNNIAITNNSSSDLKELVAQTNQEAPKSSDFNADLTEVGTYLNGDGEQFANSTKEDREEIIVKRDELQVLQEKYENEDKDKKRNKINYNITEVNSELRGLEIDLGEKYFELDTKELEYNDSELSSLIERVKSNTPDYKTDKNYIASTIFSENAEKLKEEAIKSVELASRTNSIDSKKKLLEAAHQNNLAAAANQRLSINSLKDMDSEDYVAENIPMTTNEDTALEEAGISSEDESITDTDTSTNTETETETRSEEDVISENITESGVTEENKIYETKSARESQITMQSIDQSSGLNEVRDLYGKEDPKGLAAAENEILNDWINDLNEEFQNVNASIASASGDEEIELKEIQERIIDKRNNFESLVLKNEGILSQTSSIAITDDSSDELIELVSQTNQEVALSDDFDTDVTEVGVYKSKEADQVIKITEVDREKVNIKRQEIEGLQEEYEDEKKEKKKEKIQSKINNAQEKVTNIEVYLGLNYAGIDAKELEYNDDELLSLIGRVQDNIPEFRTDKNYISATIFNDNAEALRLEGEELLKQASETSDIEEKNDLLKQAHQKNQAAAENQRLSLIALEKMDDEDYVAEIIPITVDRTIAADGEELIGSEIVDGTESGVTSLIGNEISEGTETNGEALIGGEIPEETETEVIGLTSNEVTSGPEAEVETLTGNEIAGRTETEALISNETPSGTANSTSANPKDVTEGFQTIENATKNAVDIGLNKVNVQNEGNKEFDPKISQPESYEVSTEVEEMEYANDGSFEATAATDILGAEQKSIDKLQDLNDQKDILKSKASSSDNSKQKDKLEKKENAIDKKIDKEEIKLDEAFKSINAAGIDIAKENLKQVRISFGNLEMGQNYNFDQASKYESTANELIAKSLKLRAQAENEKDKSIKNDLLKQSNSNDLKAIEYYNMASELYQQGAIENINAGIESGETDQFSSEDLTSLSQELEVQSANLNRESIDSRDSSLTAKGYEKIAMMNRADVLSKKASSINSIVNNLQLLAVQLKDQEYQIERNKELKEGLTSLDVEKVRSNSVYEEFYNNQSQINISKIEKAEVEGEKQGYENLVRQQDVAINQLKEQKAGASSESEKSSIDDEIAAIERVKGKNKEKIEALDEKIESLAVSIGEVERNNAVLIANLDPDLKDDFNALVISTIEKRPASLPNISNVTNITTEDILLSSFVAPTKLTNSIALIDNTIKYNDDNPIPLDTKNPDGLIYKVQIGAFSKPIPNDVFSGFAPITGERIGNLVRYRVGYFVDYNSANQAKNEIRALGGYSDAFVVAIKDGERISLAQARSEESGVATNTDVAINTDPVNVNTEENVSVVGTRVGSGTGLGAETGSVGGTEGTTSVVLETEEGAAQTINAAKVEGLFYTVQLGAFSQEIAADNVFNISPLVAKKVNNLYKYSTGIYRTIEEANQRKSEVVALGNADAFVAVYYNGERVTGTRAIELIAEKGDAVFATDTNGNLAQLTGGNQSELVPATEEGLFQVDLGTYQGDAPTFIANAMLTINAYKVKREAIGIGKHYFVGNFKNEKDAQAVVDLYKSNGVESVKIVEVAP